MNKDTDSVQHHEDRRTKMRAEYKQEVEKRAQAEALQQSQQADRDQVTRESEIRYLEQQVGLVKAGDTREMLLDRIRQMREPPPPPPEIIGRVSEGQIKEFNAEQEAGRAAVAKAEAEYQRIQEGMRVAEAEELKRLGTMETVHHSNPGMDEQYPASGATLGKKK
jgi:hypothetical protein